MRVFISRLLRALIFLHPLDEKEKYCTNYYTNLVIINRLCHHIPIFLFL